MTARAAFARPGPGARPFPEVSARMQPSDSPAPSVAAPVSLAASYHSAGAYSWPPCACVQTRRALEILLPDPPTAFHCGETGVSQVTVPSSSHAPWPHTPPVHHLLAPSRRWYCCLQIIRNLGLFRKEFSRGRHTRLTRSLSTLQRRRYHHHCKTRFRPAGLSFGQVGLAPTG